LSQEKKEKKRNHDLRHMKLPFLVTNQIFVPASLSCHAKRKKKTGKEKAETPKAKFPTKHIIPEKVVLIHDCACYL